MPGRGGADIGEPLNYSTTIQNGGWSSRGRFVVPRSGEECRAVPSSAGRGWGRHWGAFKLLYYHCNTTKIDRVEQPRTVCGAEECRGVPSSASSAGKGWGRHWGAFKLLYYHCNTTKIDGLWCRGVPRSVEECRVVPGRGGADIGEPLNYSTTIAIPLK